MTVRALKSPLLAVPIRKKRAIAGLIGLALILTLVTWLSTRIRPAGDKCFGDIIFRTIRSSLLGIVFCAILIPSFLIMALIIGVKLRRTVLMDHNERIAGTRMVWYLVEAAIVYIFVLPFWIQAMTGGFDANFTSSRLAEFMLFGSGSIICITHFVLRANAARLAIKPNRTPWIRNRKFRLFGPSDLEIINISPPIIKDAMELEPEDKWRSRNVGGRLMSSPTDSSPGSSVVGSSVAGNSPLKPAPALYRRNWPLLDDMERPPTPAKTVGRRRNSLPPANRHKKQPSYSLFPTEDDLQLPSTTYSPNSKTPDCSESSTRHAVPSLLPPFRPFAIDGYRESTASTATLEIGMRFSSAPAAAAAVAMRPQTPPSRAKRPSLLTSIDDFLRHTTTAEPFASQTVNSSSRVQDDSDSSRIVPSPSPTTSKIFSASRSMEPDSPDANLAVLRADTYSPLQLDSRGQQRPNGSQSVSAPSVDDVPVSLAKRVSSMYLSRSASLRKQAENNRLELANLERSGSGASRTRLRPAYPRSQTAEGSVVSESSAR